MSIIGESFDSNVSAQISVRQQLQGKQTRDNTDLNLLNNQNAWLKLASSVRIISQTELEASSGVSGSIPTYDPKSGTYVEKEENISTGEQRLRDLGITNTGLFTGNQLARKSVLFNSLTEVNPSTYDETAWEDALKTSEGSHKFRSGVINTKTNNLWSDKLYGLGSNDFGIVPPPGLISAKINCKNRGSIREATVVIKAYNLFQFELIELLYLRLGYSMMLEWGWNKFKNSKGEIQEVGNTIIEDLWFQDFATYNYRKVIDSIARYRKIYEANYDGFLGKVVNFDWSFQPDGTYDITLKLITVGDVIESLKVNLPSNLVTAAQMDQFLYQGNTSQTSQLRKLNSPIVTNAGSSTLSVDLFTDIAKSKPEKWWVWKGNYFGLFTNLKNSKDYEIPYDHTVKKQKEDETIKYPPTGTDSNKFNYYLTFYELLEKLNRLCIPTINGGKMLRFSTGGDEICSYFPNQVSFDPKVCLIKPQFDEPINASSQEGLKKKSTGVKNFYDAFSKLKDFVVQEENTNVVYGNVMNIYLNYNFVSEVLEKNTKDGDISIFKFLQSICNGVNSALGGFNKLEPVLEEDNKIKIIDQNTIPGIENSSKFGNRFNSTPPFEIFGYSTGISGSSISNFVTDFSFKTKIGPELASMITIGATAANKKTKNYDGTAFSKWNDGLEDAYSLNYKNPEQNSFKEESIDTYPFSSTQIAKMSEKFRDADFDLSILPDALAISLLTSYGVNTLRDDSNVYSEKYGIKIQGKRDVEDCPISKQDYNNVTWEEYTEEVAEWIENQKSPIEEIEASEINNYLGWLIQAFGGKVNQKVIDTKLYFFLNDDFYKIGKEVFKAFINSSNNNNYNKNKNPSNTIGFIPADLGLTIDGLSGVKIYNALAINQRFLPKSYPTSLKFIITKVDHDISANNWKTSLGTISVPKTNPPEISNYDGVTVTLENQSTSLELGETLKSIPPKDIQTYDNKDRIDINQLTTSAKGIEELKKSESFRAKAYDDFKPNVTLTKDTVIQGTLTIGYGFTKAVVPNLSWDSTLTEEEASTLLAKVLKDDYEKRLKRDIKVPLRQSEFDSLVGIIFNAGEIGNSSAGNETPLKNYINTKRYREAAEIIPFYRTTSKGIPLAGLVKRREEEKLLYLS